MAKAAPEPEPTASTEAEPIVEAPPPPEPVTSSSETSATDTAESTAPVTSESAVTVSVQTPKVPATMTESESAADEETAETQQAALTSARDAGIPGESDPDRARLLFSEDSTDLPTGVEATLNSIAERLNDDSSLRLQLHAYASGTAETASRARRMSLSRALVVRSYLMQQGIRSTRMDVRALGNKTEETPADRVDVIVVAK